MGGVICLAGGCELVAVALGLPWSLPLVVVGLLLLVVGLEGGRR